jgi:hypothetical protein
MNGQRIEPPTDLRPTTIVGTRFLFSRDGQVWRSGDDGKPKGAPIPWQSLRSAQQDAKRDPALRVPRWVGGKLAPPEILPLVFEEEGVRMVRFVHGWKMLRARMVGDPIPLHGDEATGWVAVRGQEGLLVFHAPSVAFGMFVKEREAR